MKLSTLGAGIVAIVVLSACGGGGGAQGVVPGGSQNMGQQAMPGMSSSASVMTSVADNATNYRSVCADPNPGEAACLALVRTDVDGGVNSPMHDMAQNPNATPSGYGPSQLIAAYKLNTSGGAGQTVALVESGDYKTAEADLGVYRSTYGLPACTTANGCFKKVGQTGGAVPAPNASWAQETALDMDMVSAICPNCHILIVEATSSSNANLDAAVNEAATLGATEISNSYGGSESGASNSAYNHPGILITASSGDTHTPVEQPCSYSTVVCTGGTTLKTASNSRGWAETIWSDAGGGCSADVAKPSWQSSYTSCAKRVTPDLGFDANPNTGVAVYDSTPSGGSSGWMVFGGTSVASPAISSMYALAGNAHSLTAAQSVWQHADTTAFNPIGKYGLNFDLYAGWGSPNGTTAL